MLPNGTAHDKWFTLFSFHFISSLHHFCLFWLHFAHRAPSVSFVVNYLARLLMILYVAFINPVTYGMRSILVSFITASLHLCNHKVAFEKRVWKFVQSVAILFVCVCVFYVYGRRPVSPCALVEANENNICTECYLYGYEKCSVRKS